MEKPQPGRKPRAVMRDIQERLDKAIKDYVSGGKKVSITQMANRYHLEMPTLRRHLILRGIHKVKPQENPTPHRERLKRMQQDNDNGPTTTNSVSVDDNVVQHPVDVLSGLSKEKKRAINNAISTSFDSDAGVYANGKSDQEIGRSLDVPWAAVARIRDDFFGPLRIDPEIGTLRVDLEGLRNQIASATNTESELSECLVEMEQKLTAFDVKIEELKAMRAELGEWYSMAATALEETNKRNAHLDTECRAISDRLAKLERRFG